MKTIDVIPVSPIEARPFLNVERLGTSTPNEGLPEIVVTDHDFERLTKLVVEVPPRQREAAALLDQELDRAAIVPSAMVGPDVVTMHTQFVYEDASRPGRREITLAYPDEVHDKPGNVSVLAPLGAALLGLRVGQSIAWPPHDSKAPRFRVVEVLYQPEANGRT